jgi:hypothetical protein
MKDAWTLMLGVAVPELGIRVVLTPGPREKYWR